MTERSVSFRLKALSAALLLTVGTQAAATGASVTTTVTRTMMSGDSRWGGCMAQLAANPRKYLPDCGSSWVSFSCSGDFADRVHAYRMLDQAQLAMVGGKRVDVWFQDDKKHNGYCYANRIDVHPK